MPKTNNAVRRMVSREMDVRSPRRRRRRGDSGLSFEEELSLIGTILLPLILVMSGTLTTLFARDMKDGVGGCIPSL